VTALFAAVVCLVLVVFQTTVMADLALFEGFYDLLVTFVVYLALYRRTKESLPIVVTIGFVMDSLSAAPFGLYLTGYLWIFAGIRWIMRYFHLRTSAMVMFVIPLAVAIETLFTLTALNLQVQGGIGFRAVSTRLGGQLFWALLTGPLLLMFYESVHTRIEKWAADWKVERNGF
jgi:rod shape-determining protein MreD